MWQLYDMLWRLDGTHGLRDELKAVMQTMPYRAHEEPEEEDQGAAADSVTRLTNEVG